jgi:hypothetical protein
MIIVHHAMEHRLVMIFNGILYFMKEKVHKSDGIFIACITMLSNCFYFILTLILLEIDSMPGGH